MIEFDTTCDFTGDANGRDPDLHSLTLRAHHKRLWSKPLPNGRPFTLSDAVRRPYLHYQSDGEELWLGSDSIAQTFSRWPKMQPIVTQIGVKELRNFVQIASTIGGRIVFPAKQENQKPTINVARGFHRRIADRMDLTLECIRRHYRNEDSPLAATLSRYRDFFRLFVHFDGYVEFFLLQDLLESDTRNVRFFLPFDGFRTPAVPADVESYRHFMDATIAFVEARNRRMAAWAAARSR
jgi:hypothetical protein